MRILFLILLITLSTNVFAQLQNKFEGTWKVIAVSDNEMSINLKVDSASFNETTEIDTLTAKTIVKTLMSLLGEVLYIFNKNGHFYEKHNAEGDGEGSYLVDAKKSILTLKGKRKGFAFTEKNYFNLRKVIYFLQIGKMVMN